MFQRPVYRTSLVFMTLAADAPAVAREATAARAGDAPQLIDINTASPIELAEALPGIGEVLSERIAAYRVANGPFVRTDQLLGIRGIGVATYERLRPLITVGG